MKKIILSICLILWIIWWNNFVLSYFFSDSSIKIDDKVSNIVFIDDINNKSNVVSFKSSKNISDYKIYSVCNISSKFVKKEAKLYYFDLEFLDNKCNNWNIYLNNDEWDIILNTNIKLKIISKVDLLKILLDLSNEELKNIYNKILVRKNKYRFYHNVDKNSYNLSLLKKNYKFNQYKYLLDLIWEILEKRDNKYLVPISGYKISRELNKLPNTWRPYRSKYTDWIHHWWDVVAWLWHEVIALDDWIIVRVVNDWKWSDFDKINYSIKSRDDEVKNLDILRWNQVWLKTMKWDLVFYSHLAKIYDNIRDWVFVEAWTPLWTIWVTWVPEKWYDDYHLHFPIHKNPYIIKKVWKYNYLDYMKWDWYFKWKSSRYILDHQNDIFYN